MKEYDVVVIGAGIGGYVCAIRASQLGKKVAVIDKRWLGGVCLNVGCIPTKSLLKNAEVAHTLRERGKEFGFSFDNLKLDYSVAVKRSRAVSDRLTKGVAFLMKKNNIDVIMGTARIAGKDKVVVKDVDGKSEELKAGNIVVATGSHAGMIPGVTVDGKQVVTFWEAILQETLPKSVLIIGAGALGVEFATIWNSYGSEVTLVEMLPRIVPLEDEEISAELARNFQKRGIQIHAGAKVASITPGKTAVTVKLTTSEGEKIVEVEQVLLATGFKPNTSDLGLEEIGVALTDRKFIQVNEKMATNVPGIWAVGDVTGQLLLAHVAATMGVICAENIAGVETVKLDVNMVPHATFCQPQVASFGFTEAQAREKGYDVKVGRFNFQANGKALGLGDYAGFAKIVTDAKYGEILGASLIGPDVSELLPELTLAQRNELTVEEITRNIHTHPTLSEVLLEAAESALGHSLHM